MAGSNLVVPCLSLAVRTHLLLCCATDAGSACTQTLRPTEHARVRAHGRQPVRRSCRSGYRGPYSTCRRGPCGSTIRTRACSSRQTPTPMPAGARWRRPLGPSARQPRADRPAGREAPGGGTGARGIAAPRAPDPSHHQLPAPLRHTILSLLPLRPRLPNPWATVLPMDTQA